MSTKIIYLKGKARYLRPYSLDTGDNLPDGNEVKESLMASQGKYIADILLPFDNKDDAEEFLASLEIPMSGAYSQSVKRDKETKEIYYRVKRPHFISNMPNKDTGEMGVEFGPPKVVNADGDTWDSEIAIGNGSECTFKLNVWRGDKVSKVRWEAVRVDNLVEYERPDDEGF